MPHGRLIHKKTQEYSELSRQLEAEWRTETANSAAPIIIETNDPLRPQKTPQHLYVIWDAWGHLSQQERSEMMMEVYEKVRGRAPALNVTMAMGLTHQEATGLGIRFEAAAARE